MPSGGAAQRGEPSWVWRAGQDRRLAMLATHVAVMGARVLDVGCGIGAYTGKLTGLGGRAVGTEIEWPRTEDARRRGVDVVAAVGERLPFAAESFDTALLHEVLEHVVDDRATVAEVVRSLAVGGRMAVFVPNRLWPFETHGVYWRGRYHFGNAPLVNYLPDPLRNRLAPHVRVYTRASLAALFHDLPVRIVVHTQVYPGYDNLIRRRPRTTAVLRRFTYALEATPMRAFGLSHFLVAEKVAGDSNRRETGSDSGPGAS